MRCIEDDMCGDSATHHAMAKTSLSHPPELLSVHRVISAVLSSDTVPHLNQGTPDVHIAGLLRPTSMATSQAGRMTTL